MRPVDKGESSYKEIKEHQEALPYLEKKIGLYCSYCEMPINHVPEVEHMISKKHGGKKQDKDRRFLNRNLSYNKALISLKNWNHVKDASECYQNAMKEQIIMTATADGFFSVWMMVFADEPEICLALLERYPGTNKVYYDEQGKIKQIFLKKEKTNK